MEDPVAHPGQIFIVGDDQEGLLKLVPEIEEKLMKLFGVGSVQVTRRFIGKYDIRVIDKGAGYCNPLLFPSGQGAGFIFYPVTHPQGIQQAHGLIFHFFFSAPGDPTGDTYVFQGAEFRQQVVKLEYKADMPVAKGGQLPAF